MSKKMRKSLVGSLVLAGLVVGIAWSTANARPEPREIVLEARGMAFYLLGDETPNPTLRLAPGEVVRLTLINRDRGMEHDLAIAELGFATDLLPGDGSRQTVRLRAPSRPGSFTYLCRLHVQSMRGLLEVG